MPTTNEKFSQLPVASALYGPSDYFLGITGGNVVNRVSLAAPLTLVNLTVSSSLQVGPTFVPAIADAVFSVAHNDPGAHIGSQHASVLIQAQPVGSGQNGPAQFDAALSIFSQKKNFDVARASTVHGEIEGLVVTVRQTGPTDGTIGNTARSDADAIQINAFNWGNCGFLSGVEMDVGNFDVGGAIVKEAQIQIPALNADTVVPYFHGAVFSAVVGVLDSAVLVSTGGGTWNYGLHATAGSIKAGSDFIRYDGLFSITDTGLVAIGTNINSFGFGVEVVDGIPGFFSHTNTGRIAYALNSAGSFFGSLHVSGSDVWALGSAATTTTPTDTLTWSPTRVGVKTTFALEFAAMTLANGLNSNITAPTTSYARIAGPTAGFSVGGFASPTNGQQLTVYNSVAQQMTIVNEDGSSTAVNRIKTLTGGNVVLRAGTSAAHFIYDTTDTRWVLVGTN